MTAHCPDCHEPVAVKKGAALSLFGMFALSAVSRARALHEGIVREIEADNSPSAFSLLRAFAETLAVIAYVADHPNYVDALLRHPKDHGPGAPRRRSIQTFVNHMDKHYSEQFGLVYAELSEITHYGSTAIWNAWSITDEAEHEVSWTSAPGWRSPRDMYVACAQLLELSSEMEAVLLRLIGLLGASDDFS